MHLTTCIQTSYRYILKPLLFRLDPETAHDLFVRIGKRIGNYRLTKKITAWLFCYAHPSLNQTFHRIHFANPVGLAGGFDKDVLLPDIMETVGFGFVEVGSITAQAYAGNPQPRLYRLPKDQWLVVNYGLKNLGVTHAIKQLKNIHTSLPISVSVAKTNCSQTCDEHIWRQDYITSLQALEKAQVGTMYTINISCPNTFWGEPFTTPERLERLLCDIDALSIKKPLFIKMPVNMPRPAFKELLDIIAWHPIQGVIIANLTKNREHLLQKDVPVPGGISGKPTQVLADKLIYETYAAYGTRFLIVGVGGIFSAEDAYHKIKSWASLLQLITGMIFQWPQLIGQINAWLVKLLQKDGYASLQEAIGAYHQGK